MYKYLKMKEEMKMRYAGAVLRDIWEYMTFREVVLWLPDWNVCFLRAEDFSSVKFARLEKPPSDGLRTCNRTFL